MSHDEKAGLAIIYFLVIGITANETGSPFLAIVALVLMPIAAIVATTINNSKTKR